MDRRRLFFLVTLDFISYLITLKKDLDTIFYGELMGGD